MVTMRMLGSVVLVATVVACHPSSELDGVYLSGNGSGTFFPCDSANVMFMVPDSGLVARAHAVATAPGDLLFVRLRGVKRRSGSIYDGRRWFQVEQVLEIRPRASGECPKVAHSASTVLPS
jgi:hypothetical protein